MKKINLKNIDLKKFKIALIGLVGLTVLLIIGYLLFSWNRPLSEALDLPEATPTAVDGETPEQDDSAGEGTVVPQASPTIEPVCGGPPTIQLLISGVASNTYLYGLADAVRVARIDFQHKNVTVLALPRDLWVEIPGLEGQGISVGKLNQAYFYGTEGMGYYSGSGYGSGLLAETLLDNYGFRVDRYLAVNLYSFRRIVDALGGIDVFLAQDVYRKVNEQPKLFLKAGSHHLNGKQAEMLARNRINIGDYGRINNQTVILRAVAAKMLSPSGITALPALIDQLRENVQTDLSPAEISQLICLGEMIDPQEDITFVTFPEDLLTEQMMFDPARNLNTAALVGEAEEISTLLAEYRQGIWP